MKLSSIHNLLIHLEDETKNVDGTMQVLGNVKILYEARNALIPTHVGLKGKNLQKKECKEKKLLSKRCVDARYDKLLHEKLGKARISLAQKEKELFETEAEIKDVQKNSKLNEDFAKTEKKLATIRAQVTSTSKELLGLLMNPANLNPKLWGPVKEYYSKLSKSRIPSAIAKEWLGSILEQKECICETHFRLQRSK